MSFGDRWAKSDWRTLGVSNPLAQVAPAFLTVPTLVATMSEAARVGSYFGYNIQAGPYILFGLEADVAGGASHRHIQGIPGTNTNLQRDASGVHTGWDASLRGRAGLLVAPSVQVYATGGAAWQEFGVTGRCIVVDYSWCSVTRGDASSVVKQGWTAGGGIEARFAEHWLARVEYRYSDYGRFDRTLFAGNPEQVKIQTNLRTQTAMVGLAYQFSDSTPSTASSMAMAVKAKAAPLTQPSSWTTTFASDVRYYSWEANRGFPNSVRSAQGSGSGWEVYTPLAMQVVGQTSDNVKVELLARGGWVSARQTTAGLSGGVDTATDTQLTANMTYLGINGFQPFAAMSANLPTGSSNLGGAAALARMDPDLVGIGSFGEGFNIGPTLGFNVSVTSQLVFATSVGYTWRGNYIRENSLSALDPTVQAQTRIEPGHLLTLTETAAFQIGQLATQLTASVSQETATAENGVALYRPGLRYTVSGSWNYSWPEQWGVTNLTAGFSHTARSEVLLGGLPPPVRELVNSSSDLYRVGIQHLFPVGSFAIGPSGTYLHRNHNSYDPVALQFVPEKKRWSVGFVARYAATDAVSFNVRLDRVWTRESENPALGGNKVNVLNGVVLPFVSAPVINGTGWQATGGINASF